MTETKLRSRLHLI